MPNPVTVITAAAAARGTAVNAHPGGPGGPTRFKTPRSPRLGPRHGDLVDALRALLDRHADVDLGELGAAVRLQLGQREVARPGQRISELALGSRFPSAGELDAIVQRCAGNAPVLRERFARLHAAAARERQTRRTNPAAPAPSPLGAVAGSRVGDPRSWTRLGVHAPITLLSDGQDLSARAAAGELPGYVLREVDQTELRPALQAVADGAPPPVRLVVIVGESAAGKSRAAAEAVRTVLPDWTLVVPRRPADLVALHPDQRGGVSPAQVVVWLDEIQHLLTPPDAVAALHRLLDLPAGPVVLLATLRTDAEFALRDSPGWQLLDRADHRITLHRRSPDRDVRERELARARDLADAGDPWLAEALDKTGDRYGIAEWLAAGPQLLRELERARSSDADPVARLGAAIVDAAVDCYRAGYTRAVPAPLLHVAARLYLDDRARFITDERFAAALEWARRPVAGATGLLLHRRARGDLAFDYLIGHASRHGAVAVPDRLWPILARHLTPATHATVAIAAAHNGHRDLALQLADRRPDTHLYAELSDVVGLARLADAGDWRAADLLAELLAERGDQTGLPSHPDVAGSDLPAAHQLAELLARRGDEAELQRRADAGDQPAARRLAELLAERGDATELQRRADAGDQPAVIHLAQLLARRRDEAGLQRRADAGEGYAGDQLAWLLARRGDAAGLERRADAGEQYAARLLAELLAERGDEAGLQRRAAAGDQPAADLLADVLAEEGDEVELQRRADAGNRQIASYLVELLAERGDEAGLQRRADAGDWLAAYRLVGLLAVRGDEPGLERRAAAGDSEAADEIARLRARSPR